MLFRSQAGRGVAPEFIAQQHEHHGDRRQPLVEKPPHREEVHPHCDEEKDDADPRDHAIGGMDVFALVKSPEIRAALRIRARRQMVEEPRFWRQAAAIR